MKKNLKTGEFLIPEDEKAPIVLFTFNQFEDEVTNVTYQLKESSLKIYYPSGNTLDVECSNSGVMQRIIKVGKFIVIEVDDNSGDVAALYEVYGQ